MSAEAKECCHHKQKWSRFWRLFCASLLIAIFILLFIILIVWAVLQPRKPRFILQDATLYVFNVSAPNLVSLTLQVTIYSRNRNDRIGVYYDRLDVYGTYRSQQVTYYTGIPPVYQGHKDVNVWSPFLTGNNVPIAPYNGVALSQDQAAGTLFLLIKLDGRVRWKVGSVTTGRYRLHVRCPAYIPFGNNNTGVAVGTAIKYQLSQRCRVSV